MDRLSVHSEWVCLNAFLPKYKSINECAEKDAFCAQEKQRRRDNFLKSEAAHFFGSPLDDVISPWQASVLQPYSDVDTWEEIETKLDSLYVIPFNDTPECVNDTYSLRAPD